MMSQDLDITIGIVSFREGELLHECWNSVLAQTDNGWRAIIILDGRSDMVTREIFNSLLHPQLVKYEMKNNVGLSGTRNKIFELMATQYCQLLDADDQLPSEAVAILRESIKINPDAGLIYGDYNLIGESGAIWRFKHTPCESDFIESQAVPGNSLIRKSSWVDIGGYSRELSFGNQDYDFLIGMREKGTKMVHCGNVIYCYRRTSANSMSKSYKLRYHKTHSIIIKRHPIYFSDSARRFRFMALGFRTSAIANNRAGKLSMAAWFALRAKLYGIGPDERLQKIWRKAARAGLSSLIDYLPGARTLLRVLRRQTVN